MAAEIQNELGNLGPAKDYLKQVRQRAFAMADRPAKVDAYLDAITTKEQMFNAIVNEHAFEFCGEMERKAALIRWNLLGSKITEAKAKMTSLSNREGSYADVPEKIYYRYASDGESLQFYGLNRGETEDRSADYTFNTVYVSTDKLGETKINSLFTNNPDQNQFWPIWQVFIDASNGTLKNDYGY